MKLSFFSLKDRLAGWFFRRFGVRVVHIRDRNTRSHFAAISAKSTKVENIRLKYRLLYGSYRSLRAHVTSTSTRESIKITLEGAEAKDPWFYTFRLFTLSLLLGSLRICVRG